MVDFSLREGLVRTVLMRARSSLKLLIHSRHLFLCFLFATSDNPMRTVSREDSFSRCLICSKSENYPCVAFGFGAFLQALQSHPCYN